MEYMDQQWEMGDLTLGSFFASLKHHTKTERNQNIANAFYQGGHTQTAIALAFDVSTSTVSRVIKEYENGR